MIREKVNISPVLSPVYSSNVLFCIQVLMARCIKDILLQFTTPKHRKLSELLQKLYPYCRAAVKREENPYNHPITKRPNIS